MKDPAATLRTYFTVFGCLIAFTVLTVAAAAMHLPPSLDWLHTPIAFAIAGVKALLVLLFFMHLWHSPRLFWLVAFGALLWLAIMMVLTFADYMTRAWLVP
jgi:cytochrome c oxidase subunit IV